jgi:formylglycine-generating enzyme
VAVHFLLLGLLESGGCHHFGDGPVGAMARCADGLIANGPRCCAEGQHFFKGHCVGRPKRCPLGWSILDETGAIDSGSGDRELGCVWVSHAVKVAEGRYVVGPNDWESEDVVAREGHVAAFWLDAGEVTVSRYARCAAAGQCRPRSSVVDRPEEPGLPVATVTAAEAESFCAWMTGRLPRSDEWLRAATGQSSRRFPWGQTGLVCRRASFGLVRGPCAEGGSVPDLVGARPDGRSDAGLNDLVGNVAEIVRTAQGTYEVRGGSFRSDHAAELKSWSVLPYSGARPDVGFRCAYDHEPDVSGQ